MTLTEHGALKKAKAMSGRMSGTAAMKIVADEETGELESAMILAQFGAVLEDFAESLTMDSTQALFGSSLPTTISSTRNAARAQARAS